MLDITVDQKKEKLFYLLSAMFSVIVVLSNIISAKMVFLSFFKISIPAGLITYPLTFLLSDLVTEIFGEKKARLMVYIALGMNLLSFGIFEMALLLPSENLEEQAAFQKVFKASSLRIFSSLLAYFAAHMVDIKLYVKIKNWTGSRFLWLRNNSATCLSQMIDTIMIDLLFLFWGLGMSMAKVLPIMIFSFSYKAIFSLLCTPLFYLGVFFLRRLLKKNKEIKTES